MEIAKHIAPFLVKEALAWANSDRLTYCTCPACKARNNNKARYKALRDIANLSVPALYSAAVNHNIQIQSRFTKVQLIAILQQFWSYEWGLQ